MPCRAVALIAQVQIWDPVTGECEAVLNKPTSVLSFYSPDSVTHHAHTAYTMVTALVEFQPIPQPY